MDRQIKSLLITQINMKEYSCLSSHLRLFSVCVNALHGQLDHLHLVLVSVRRQLHYCVEWHIHVWQLICERIRTLCQYFVGSLLPTTDNITGDEGFRMNKIVYDSNFRFVGHSR